MQALYLYSNDIRVIRGLDACLGLTALYLQANQISEIGTALANCISLEKLHLSHNSLACIDGLQNCKALRELYVQNQRGTAPVTFDSATLASLSASLTTLNASGNRLADAAPLGQLEALEVLRLADNAIGPEASESLSLALAGLPRLRELALKGNPITRSRKLRTSVILLCPWLVAIDDRPITQEERLFLENWQAQKRHASRHIATAPAAGSPEYPATRADALALAHARDAAAAAVAATAEPDFVPPRRAVHTAAAGVRAAPASAAGAAAASRHVPYRPRGEPVEL